ncbi:MAG: hypothetical protein QME89_12285, partial [Actinomycetota bacterium]|nr:hypothetical protein [Actinomycetota bacterium]
MAGSRDASRRAPGFPGSGGGGGGAYRGSPAGGDPTSGPPDPEDRKWGFSPDNLSAIAETGNILFNAYLTAVSRTSGLELYPGTPACAADMLEAVVNTVLLE